MDLLFVHLHCMPQTISIPQLCASQQQPQVPFLPKHSVIRTLDTAQASPVLMFLAIYRQISGAGERLDVTPEPFRMNISIKHTKNETTFLQFIHLALQKNGKIQVVSEESINHVIIITMHEESMLPYSSL